MLLRLLGFHFGPGLFYRCQIDTSLGPDESHPDSLQKPFGGQLPQNLLVAPLARHFSMTKFGTGRLIAVIFFNEKKTNVVFTDPGFINRRFGLSSFRFFTLYIFIIATMYQDRHIYIYMSEYW